MTNSRYRHYMNSRRNGFGMNLYRNKKSGKIGGVCAGIADHFEIDHNIMRIAFIAALLFTGVLAFWAYVIAWVVLVPKQDGEDVASYEYDEQERCYRKKKMFRYAESTSKRLDRAGKRLDEIVQRVEGMERYVTSNKFNLNRQFADLEK